MEDTRPKTIFCDIDGTLVEHMMPNDVMKPDSKMKVLPGAIEKILEQHLPKLIDKKRMIVNNVNGIQNGNGLSINDIFKRSKPSK